MQCLLSRQSNSSELQVTAGAVQGSSGVVLRALLAAPGVVVSLGESVNVGVTDVAAAASVEEEASVKGSSVGGTGPLEQVPENTSISSIAISLLLPVPGEPIIRIV